MTGNYTFDISPHTLLFLLKTIFSLQPICDFSNPAYRSRLLEFSCITGGIIYVRSTSRIFPWKYNYAEIQYSELNGVKSINAKHGCALIFRIRAFLLTGGATKTYHLNASLRNREDWFPITEVYSALISPDETSVLQAEPWKSIGTTVMNRSPEESPADK